MAAVKNSALKFFKQHKLSTQTQIQARHGAAALVAMLLDGSGSTRTLVWKWVFCACLGAYLRPLAATAMSRHQVGRSSMEGLGP